MSPEEATEIVKRDAVFYRNSGGGVTVSGGEALHQPGFAAELLKQCQAAGIHTVLDTAGHAPWETLVEILRYVDLTLYDLKHMDPAEHYRLTGVDNVLILKNARLMAKKGIPMVIRLPLIAGINDSEINLRMLRDFIIEVGRPKVEILAYHNLGDAKYLALGFEPLPFSQYQKAVVRYIKELLSASGAEVQIL